MERARKNKSDGLMIFFIQNYSKEGLTERPLRDLLNKLHILESGFSIFVLSFLFIIGRKYEFHLHWK